MSDERSLEETPRAAAAFAEYCELGPARSLVKLLDRLRQTDSKATARLRTLEEWSSAHKWQERVKQYDAQCIAERAAKKKADREEMEDRHAKDAKEEQEWARDLLRKSKDKGKVSLAVVHLLKNSREDERKALVEEDLPKAESVGPLVGIAIYLPQKRALKGGEADVSDEDESEGEGGGGD